MNPFITRHLRAIKFIDFCGCDKAEAIQKCKNYIDKYDKPFNQLKPWQYLRLERVKGALAMLEM